MMPRPECPIYRRVSSGGDQLASALHRLRKFSRVCSRCQRRASCDALRLLQEWVGALAREVLDELRS